VLDFLIVGQGIAGSVLAWELLQRGQRLLVINNSERNCASRVAAGIYNPITGKAMVKTWLAERLFSRLHHFYQAVGQAVGTPVHHPLPLFRPFLTPEERARWLSQAAQYSDFIASIADSTYCQEHMVYHYGGLVLRQAGYLDVPCFLRTTRAYLAARKQYREADFAYDAMEMHADHVRYRDVAARYVLFCEGPQVRHNPFFKTLPFRLVKGELLSVALPAPLSVIYNRQVFVVPRAGQQALIGATYDRSDRSLTPTRQARNTVETQLQQTFKLSYTVQEQWVGLRPATFDHRPIVGLHPQYPHLGLFNGLGTKGVSLAPYFAQIFAAHLLHKTALPLEVQLTRKPKRQHADIGP